LMPLVHFQSRTRWRPACRKSFIACNFNESLVMTSFQQPSKKAQPGTRRLILSWSQVGFQALKIFLSLVYFTVFLATIAFAQSPVGVTVDTRSRGYVIPADFAGIG